MIGFPSPARLRFLLRNPREFWAAAGIRPGLGMLAQRARLAQLRRDWRAALRLWQACVEKAPNDPAAATGYIGALISAGGIDEAAEQAAALVQRHPKDENGPAALARIAELRGDFAAAVQHWCAALSLKPGNAQALIRLGAALLKEGRFEEALACAERLETLGAAQSHGAVLRAQAVQQERGFAEAASLWEAAQARFGNEAAFLRAYGRALLAANTYDECLGVAGRLRKSDPGASLNLEGAVLARRAPYQDHSGFWKKAAAKLPDSIDFTRKLLHAALWARDLRRAEAAFDRLVQQRQLGAADTDYVVGLGHLHLDLGNTEAARATVRRFMRAVWGRFDYRAAGLRLDRMILSCFPRQPGAAAALARSKDRFITIIRKAGVAPEAKHSLERVAELESGLRRSGAPCLFDTDIDPQSCGLFVHTVLDRLARAEPFSLIRLGDGEANALDYDPAFADRFDEDAAARERVWWGRTLDSEARSNLAHRVREAIDDADCLGIPVTARFLRDLRLKTGPPLCATRSGRGLLSIVGTLERQLSNGDLNGRLLTSAHIHQDLERWNLYGELLGEQKEVVLVSCHPGLPDKLCDRFGATVVKHVITPPGDAMLEMQGRSLRNEEVPPLSLEHSLQELGEWPQGRLVLVGAGYAGKVIVHEARERGGVALDLGSIFDHWMGLSTRSYQDLA